jgi:MerR family transcriptional regulator, copper efflux regulator
LKIFKTILDSVVDYRVYNKDKDSKRIKIEGFKFMKKAYNYRQNTAETNSGKSLKIGEVSRLSGIGIEALRFYEKNGLLNRPGRTYSGYRIYDESVLTRLDFIKKAQVLGFSLNEIKQLIDHKSSGENPCAEVREIVKTRLEELDERIRQMLLYREELATALEEWEETGESDGHVCGLIENSHIEHGLDHKKQVKN